MHYKEPETMSNQKEAISLESHRILDEWLESCTRGGKISRNTVAVGIVVVDHLRQASPIAKETVISSGGEIKGARSGLGQRLEKYKIPESYLKEITTRQAHQDGQRLFEAFQWGNQFMGLSNEERDGVTLGLIGRLVQLAQNWLERQNLKIDIDRRQAPTAWIQLLVENAKSRSGGILEQHLVGAKLERRFTQITIPNHPAHAADKQTSREGDFSVSDMVYHVTATPGRSVIQKCGANLRANKYPILIVPSDQEGKAKALAEDEGIDKELTILTIEGFVAVNIIELATEEKKGFFQVLQEIVGIYNRRLAEVETDLSLQIEVR
jgi:uncharacterized protein DUF4928